MEGVGAPAVVVEFGVCGEKADGGAAATAVRAAVDVVDDDVDAVAVASCGWAMACVVSCPGACACCALRSAGSRAARSMAPRAPTPAAVSEPDLGIWGCRWLTGG